MGCVFIFIALTWNMSFPIGKKLWTSPFTLLTTGIDMVMISALIYVVEVRAWNKYNWTSFFTTVGKNPLAIYILSESIDRNFLDDQHRQQKRFGLDKRCVLPKNSTGGHGLIAVCHKLYADLLECR
jgi:predicted acyltransferase